jgi:hypothetical protein
MSISFVCRCGKRLRAREDMAARRSMCPRCGAPVGIPSLDDPGDGRTGAMSREEIAQRDRGGLVDPAEADTTELGKAMIRVRRRRDSRTLNAPLDWRPLDAPLVCPPSKVDKPKKERRRRQRYHLETRWYHVLLYPLRAWMVIIGLSCALAVFGTAAMRLVPLVMDTETSVVGWVPLLLLVPPLLVVAVVVGFLDEVLQDAASGEYVQVRWPTNDFARIVRGVARWLTCVAAGPLWLLLVANWFWINCGDPALIDSIILGELIVVAAVYGLLALLATADVDRIASVAPHHIGPVVVRLGGRLAWAALIPPVLFGCGWLVSAAQEVVETEPMHAFGMFLGAWLIALFSATFLLRLLGLACYHTRPETPADEKDEEVE